MQDLSVARKAWPLNKALLTAERLRRSCRSYGREIFAVQLALIMAFISFYTSDTARPRISRNFRVRLAPRDSRNACMHEN